MPRKRKGPPQESIDSILLAISRRETIDAETLSHYLDRLDEEWTEGAREKVLHLLRTNDAAAHAAAVLILSELATDFDLEELEDFITDPTVSDIAKLTLSPILKELSSELAEDGMIEYLNDPAAAMQQMQMRMLDLVEQSEMGVEAILVDVASMPIERRLNFIAWLGNSHDARAATLLVPLLENQPSKVITTAIDSLERLGPIALQQALPALHHLVGVTSNREVKQHGRAALGRLTMLARPGEADDALAEAVQPQLPPYEARVSFIDGTGSQLIMLSWRRPDGLLKGVNILFQDQYGIKDCYGVDEIEEVRWRELATDMDKQNFGGFTVPFEYGLAFVAEARAVNRHTRRKLPITYAIWRPLLEGIELAKKKKTIPQLSSLRELPLLDEDTLALAQHGAELYQLPQFTSWMFEPFAHILPYMDRYWSTQPLPNLPLFTMRNLSASSHGKKAREREQQGREEQTELLESLIDEALDQIITEQWRQLYETRLRRQALLFTFAGREHDARIMSAVARLLQPEAPLVPREQPFLRAMLRLSIMQGPMRMVVESLDTESASSWLDMFDRE